MPFNSHSITSSRRYQINREHSDSNCTLSIHLSVTAWLWRETPFICTTATQSDGQQPKPTWRIVCYCVWCYRDTLAGCWWSVITVIGLWVSHVCNKLRDSFLSPPSEEFRNINLHFLMTELCAMCCSTMMILMMNDTLYWADIHREDI